MGTDSKEEESETIREFDDILGHVNSWGFYQWMLLVYTCGITMLLSYVQLASVLFLYEPPDFRCAEAPPPENGTGAEGEAPTAAACDFDQDLAKKCCMPRTPESTELVKCQYGYEYNLDGLFTTAVTDMDWVCDDAWRGPFTQTMFFLGSFFGSLIFGVVSDKVGRYPTFCITNVINLTGGIAISYCYDFATFTAVRFLTGLSYITFFNTLYIIALEFVSVERRSIIGNVGLAVGYTIGGTAQPYILRAIGDWRIFHQVLFAQGAIVLISPFIMNESVRWLVGKGKIDRAVNILKVIAKRNGRQVEDDVWNSFERMAQEQHKKASKDERPSVLDLFRTPRLRKHVLLTMASWALTYFVFDGYIRNIVNLDYDIYITFALMAGMELPADLLTIPLMDWIGRRWCGAGSLFLSGIAMGICGLLLGNSIATVTIAVTGRFMVTFALNTMMQISSEILPTQLRGQGVAIMGALSQISNMVSPFVAYSAQLYKPLPFYLLCLGGILAAAALINLPETCDERLPETLAEAEAFGLGQGFFLVPYLERRRKKRMKRMGAENYGSTVQSREEEN